jgi:hypothetical protein
MESTLQVAQKVVLAEKPKIHGQTRKLDPQLRDTLLQHLSTLAAVYHKLPQEFVKRQRIEVQSLSELEAKREADGDAGDDKAADCPSASGVVDGSAGSLGGPRESEPTAMDLLGGIDNTHVCTLTEHRSCTQSMLW